MIRRPPRSTLSSSSAASDVYKRQEKRNKKKTGIAVGHDATGRKEDCPEDKQYAQCIRNSDCCSAPAGGGNRPGKNLPDTGKHRIAFRRGGAADAPRAAGASD